MTTETTHTAFEAAPALEARNLRKVFRTAEGDLLVLDELSLLVRSGEMVAIVGESGVGKSTLLHLLGGLDSPTAGATVCGGATLSSMSEDERARFRNAHLGFVFQFHHLLEDFTALENVTIPALIAGRSFPEARAQAKEILIAVGLGLRMSHLPGQLSGGEQQRVAVARALVNAPRVVLADEPTGNLDTATAERLSELLTRLNAERGVSFVIATHNQSLAKRCHAVYALRGGCLVAA